MFNELTRVIDAIKADPHDACQVLRKCPADGALTDEILKGF